MFGLIAVGAAIFLGGAWALCKCLEASNSAKRERLEHERERTERQLRNRAQEIERVAHIRASEIRRRALVSALETAKAEEHEAVRHWNERKAMIGELLLQTAAAYDRKGQLKDELNRRKRDLLRAAHGRWVDFRQDELFQRLLAQVREISAFCQSCVEHQQVMIAGKRKLFEVMQDCNRKVCDARSRLFAYDDRNYLLNFD